MTGPKEAGEVGHILQPTLLLTRLDVSVVVPFGAFDGVLVIKEWNPMEPDVVEEKYFASGVGVILEQKIEGGSETVELISAETGG